MTHRAAKPTSSTRLSRATGRRVAAGAGAIALLAVSGLVLGGSAQADAPTDYELLAGASSLDIHIADNNLPVTQVVDASPYGASATLSSSGVVKADAGAPYAPFGYSLPSTVTGLGAGNLPAIPPFPGYVAASYPANAIDEQKTGGYELSARTAERSSVGSVRLGQIGSDSSTGFAIARATANDDGTVTTEGAAGASAFSFGGVLDLGRVSSVLSMTKSPNGKPVITGTTDLGTVTVASNFPSGIRDDGSLVAGAPVPLTPSSITALNAALEPQGLALTYLPRTFTYTDGTTSTGAQPDARKTIRTVSSGALQVRSSQNVPTQGKVDVVYTFGRVTLSATNGGSVTTGADVVDSTVGGISPELSGAIDAAAGQLPGALPPDAAALPETATGQLPGAVPTVELAPAASPQTGVVALAGRAASYGESPYLMLVVAALGALGAAHLVRFLAVK
ncbi:hypothetical protein GCM10009547_19690 [Sporichthya brevicatena]|uniref:Uncharacterized protein n=1 Tax=Sporichthya brevicatena TaxID=171442 RepID=A0ABP3RYQ2_9ACTN